MPSVGEIELVRQLLTVPGPGAEVTAAGRAGLDALAAGEAQQRNASRRERGPAGRPGVHRARRARVLLACGAAITAAAVAVAVVALRPASGARPGPGPRATAPAAAGHHDAPATASAAVPRAILTAVSSAGGDILYLRRSREPALAPAVVQEWFWPSQPVPGQQVHLLIVQSAGVEAEITFTAAAGDQYTNGSTGPAITGTEVIIDTRARTWSVQHGVTIRPNLPEATSVAQLRQDIADHLWTVTGSVKLAGQAAIELVTTRPGPNGLTEQLWVSARSYLPMRQVKHNWNGPGSTLTYDFQYLPATPAGQAKLRPAVPLGYRQVPG